MEQPFESRDPVHGFVTFSAWERDIINHDVFQRLRRIRQLAWTEMVYPGAVHTRFEHSLGVMHTATRMCRQLAESSARLLRDLGISKETGLDRDLQIVRLAALLHDVGHSPFSHAGEELMPLAWRSTRAAGTRRRPWCGRGTRCSRRSTSTRPGWRMTIT